LFCTSTMMFSPLTSYATTPAAGRPSDDQRREARSVAFVTTTTEDDSPTFSGFGSSDRKPLSPLGTNNENFGMRNRRQQKDNATMTSSLKAPSAGLARTSEQFKGPPRGSLTMGMGNVSNAMVPTDPMTSDVSYYFNIITDFMLTKGPVLSRSLFVS
jgi:hypothetical protein